MDTRSKTGQGAFLFIVTAEKLVLINGRQFASPQAAYDWYKPMADNGSHSAWNICYHLEDFIR